MGLIAAVLGSASSVLADSWKEFFVCESLPADVLVVKGVKRTGKGSQNTKGSDNIISNGSGVVVADGQCMIIVDQGKIVEVCAEPGEYTYDMSSEPSLFSGSLGQAIKDTFAQIGKRIGYGGDTGKDQRVYYFNTKEIIENKFGTPSPIPLRIVDRNIGLDIDSSVRCSGIYSYKITNPLLFYTNVCGNVTREFTRADIDQQLKTEFVSKLQPAFAKLSEEGMRPSAIPGHAEELAELMNQELDSKWSDLRGIEVVSVALNPITIPAEDEAMIKELQRTAVYQNTNMAAANLVNAQAEAMKAAASNQGGAMTGFMGLNMAQQAGGLNAAQLFQMNPQPQAPQQDTPAPAPAAPAEEGGWVCPTCGTQVAASAKFCSECGTKKPEGPAKWFCPECGSPNTGKFCTNCGTKKPE